MSLTDANRRELALREIEARRAASLQIVMALELRHPTLEAPVRVVSDVAGLTARIEEDADVDAGAIVAFEALAFRAAPPEQAAGRWPEIELELDGAASVMEPYLAAAMRTDAPIEVVWREYVRASALDGPGRVIRGLELDRTRSTDLTVVGTAGLYGPDKRFGRTYDLEEYPGLV